MQARVGGRSERIERGIHVFLAGSAKRRDPASANFGGDGAHALAIALGGDGKTRFDDVDTEIFELVRHAQLFLAVHGEARRLLAVAQSGVEYADDFHR